MSLSIFVKIAKKISENWSCKNNVINKIVTYFWCIHCPLYQVSKRIFLQTNEMRKLCIIRIILCYFPNRSFYFTSHCIHVFYSRMHCYRNQFLHLIPLCRRMTLTLITSTNHTKAATISSIKAIVRIVQKFITNSILEIVMINRTWLVSFLLNLETKYWIIARINL